eukprot:2438473-Alexandrium_andersonii.AAC.1
MTRNVVTWWYRAPELVWAAGEGESRCDQSVDVWSVGCVTYELLEGQALCWDCSSDSQSTTAWVGVIGPCPE